MVLITLVLALRLSIQNCACSSALIKLAQIWLIFLLKHVKELIENKRLKEEMQSLEEILIL